MCGLSDMAASNEVTDDIDKDLLRRDLARMVKILNGTISDIMIKCIEKMKN